MICDEVQCGMGRTGTWFGFQHAGITPDVVTLAKGLGGGVPVGACIAAGKAAGLFNPGNHGSTFGGNQLATTAAMTTINVIEKDGLIANAESVGQLIRQGLAQSLAGVPGVVAIRAAIASIQAGVVTTLTPVVTTPACALTIVRHKLTITQRAVAIHR